MAQAPLNPASGGSSNNESMNLRQAADHIGQQLEQSQGGQEDNAYVRDQGHQNEDNQFDDDNGDYGDAEFAGSNDDDYQDANEDQPNDALSDDAEAQFPTTISELAEATGLDLEDILGLNHSFKAAGEDVTVTLSELTKGNQRDADYRQRTSKLAEEMKAFEQQRQQYEQNYQAQIAPLAMFLQQSQNLLVGDLNNEQLAQLRETNPGEWAKQRQLVQDRMNGLQQIYNQASQQYNHFTEQQQMQQLAMASEMLEKSTAKLEEVIPNWGPEKSQQLTGYLSDAYGYTSDELNGVADWRLIDIANKAAEYDKIMANSKKAVKEVRKVPKAIKSGGKMPAKGGDIQINKLKARAKKTGNLQDAANLINAQVNRRNRRGTT
jgi:hypothetical protein